MSLRAYRQVLMRVPAPCDCGDNKWVGNEEGDLQCINCAVVAPFPQPGMTVAKHIFSSTNEASPRFYNRYRDIITYTQEPP